MRIRVNTRAVTIEDQIEIRPEWSTGYTIYLDISSVDGRKCCIFSDSCRLVYDRIINPLVNGELPDDYVKCLFEIADRIRSQRTREKYFHLLAEMGPDCVRKWFNRKPWAVLKRNATFRNGGVLAFACDGGSIIFARSPNRYYIDMYIYAGGRDGADGEDIIHKVELRTESHWLVVITESIDLLKKNPKYIIIEMRKRDSYPPWCSWSPYIRCITPDPYNRYELKEFMRKIPYEWLEPLGLDRLAVQYVVNGF